jgi:hypothetical protein
VRKQVDLFFISWGWSGTESTNTKASKWSSGLWVWGVRWNTWKGKPTYSEKTCISAALFATKTIWPNPGSNPDRWGEKSATNLLSHGKTKSNRFIQTSSLYSPLLSPCCHPSSLIQYTVAMIPWTADQRVSRPLSTHRRAQTENKTIQTFIPRAEFEVNTSEFKRAKTIEQFDRFQSNKTEMVAWTIMDS